MRDGPDAVIFDLDGVITFTARVHAAAWKELFDDYLRDRAARIGTPFQPFDAAADYYAYVDGKPRYDGVHSFLRSRAIEIPHGSPSDSPEDETVCGLGNRKDGLFNRKIAETGVDMDAEAVRFAHELRNRGVRVGLASSSRNAVPILQKAGILNLFDAIVDGLVSESLHLRGKPEADIFLQCLAELDRSLSPQRAAVVEDAISGVEAGRTGGFALVLGVDRHHTGALEQHGANWVINDFSEITADQVSGFFTARARAAQSTAPSTDEEVDHTEHETDHDWYGSGRPLQILLHSGCVRRARGEGPALTARLKEKGFLTLCQHPRFLNRAGDLQKAAVKQTRRDARFRFSLPWCPSSKASSVELEEQSCDFARVNLAPSFLI